MWEMLGNILLYDMSYDTVSPSNSLSYAMSYDSIKQTQCNDCKSYRLHCAATKNSNVKISRSRMTNLHLLYLLEDRPCFVTEIFSTVIYCKSGCIVQKYY